MTTQVKSATVADLQGNTALPLSERFRLAVGALTFFDPNSTTGWLTPAVGSLIVLQRAGRFPADTLFVIKRLEAQSHRLMCLYGAQQLHSS